MNVCHAVSINSAEIAAFCHAVSSKLLHLFLNSSLIFSSCFLKKMTRKSVLAFSCSV
jgi:hypothetical protein